MFRFDSSDIRGLLVIQIDPTSCTFATQYQLSDPYTDLGGPFSSFISNVTNGSVIAAVTMRNPQENYVDASLASLGVFANDVPVRGSFAFVAQKGYGYKTVLSKALKNDCSVTSYVSVTIFGEFSLLMLVY
jgi:hypothetical protein